MAPAAVWGGWEEARLRPVDQVRSSYLNEGTEWSGERGTNSSDIPKAEWTRLGARLQGRVRTQGVAMSPRRGICPKYGVKAPEGVWSEEEGGWGLNLEEIAAF